MMQTLRQMWQRDPIVRLTTAYVGILVILCSLFSSVLYVVANNELQRAFDVQTRRELRHRIVDVFESADMYEQWRTERILRGHNAVVFNLAVFNVFMITVGGVASYFFAKRTFRPIERALKAQTRFSSDAAHELRTPLAIIRSESEVALRSKAATKADLRDVIESTVEEVTHMQSLTDRLLSLASNEPIKKTKTTLQYIIDDISPALTALCEQKNIILDISVDDSPVVANAASIQDVLQILVDNAVKYSEDGAIVRIAASRSEIKVIDTGVGIPADEQKRIFDHMYRTDASRNSTGHGLGLSIARRIMERHGGELRVKSKVGAGSTFTISI